MFITTDNAKQRILCIKLLRLNGHFTKITCHRISRYMIDTKECYLQNREEVNQSFQMKREQ